MNQWVFPSMPIAQVVAKTGLKNISKNMNKIIELDDDNVIVGLDDLPRCKECNQVMKEVWDNTGWDGYEGPRHDEVIGYEPCTHETGYPEGDCQGCGTPLNNGEGVWCVQCKIGNLGI